VSGVVLHTTAPLGIQQFADRTVSLVDGAVRISRKSRIGIGDRDASEALARDQIRCVGGVEVLVPKRIVFRRVTMRPAIDRDA
jgi:hypothetical protein